MRLLLVNAPLLWIDQLERAQSSTHLHLIYSHLRDRGVEVEVLDPTLDLGLPCGRLPAYLASLEEALLRNSSYTAAGISAWTSYQYLGAVEVGRLLRRAWPSLPLAVGGYHATACPEDFCGPDSPFDWVVQGPGEQVLLRICQEPARNPEPVVVRGTPAPLEDLRYDWSYPYAQGGLFLSRGCPHRCTYCSSRSSPPVHASVAQAVSEYERAAAATTTGFLRVQDACFGIEATWRRAFLSALASNPSPVRPDLEVRVDQLEEQDLALLGRVRAHVYFGIESGSPEMLRLMNKTRNPEAYLARVPQVLRMCDDLGVDYSVGAIVNHPGETRATLRQSVDAFWHWVWHGPSSRMQHVVRHTFAFFPGSPFAAQRQEYFERFGTVVHHPDWWRTTQGDQRTLSETTTASRDLPLSESLAASQRLGVADFVLRARTRDRALAQAQ